MRCVGRPNGNDVVCLEMIPASFFFPSTVGRKRRRENEKEKERKNKREDEKEEKGFLKMARGYLTKEGRR